MKYIFFSSAFVLIFLFCLCEISFANEDADEMNEQGVITIRFTIGAQGMGFVKCGNCSTAAGCTNVWIGAGTKIKCIATSASTSTFTHWTANGNYAGDKPEILFGNRGATLIGHFQ
jgi:hypothetical protein